MRTPLIITGTTLVAVLVVLPLRVGRPPAASASYLRLLCGSERWSVKTFSDRDRFKVDLHRRFRTVKQLNQLRRPARRPPNGRTAAELLVYRVTATVTDSINEDDGDVHLVLTGEDGSTLIAEAPEPACTPNARDRAAISRARLVAQDIPVGTKVVASGLGFFDFAHHQTGHARNYVELHPLLSLRRL